MPVDDLQDPPEVHLDDHAELYALWAEAHEKRVVWERQEKAAREQIFELFADVDDEAKAALGVLDSQPVVRYVRVDYDTIDQAQLKKHYPQIFEACCTKHVSYEQLRVLGDAA